MEAKMKTISDWTRKEFDATPEREWNADIGEFDSLIILPTKRIHDSGFRCMDFIAVLDDKPIAKLSGCSDVIHIDGIGGYGYKWLERYGTIPQSIKPIAWNIDCLKKSGLLRLFTGGKLTAGAALSSFEIFGVPRK